VIQEALERIRSEFMEMPGMRLTAAQVQRLCGIDALVCEAVLKALVDSKFLTHHADGIYTRVTLDTVRHPQQLKAALRTSALSQARDESHVMARYRRG
jgi:hypothetical protein